MFAGGYSRIRLAAFFETVVEVGVFTTKAP